MNKASARLFAPLPTNPLHRHMDIDSNQIETDLIKNSTSDFTIIEITKPDKHKHDSNKNLPAFVKSYAVQDLSMESATMMNLQPLKSFLQGESSSSFFSNSHMDTVVQSSAISSLPTGKVGLKQLFNSTCQQLPVQGADDSSETQSLLEYVFSDDGNSIFKTLAFMDSKSMIGQGCQLYPLTKVKVVAWAGQLCRYHFLWEIGKMTPTHAAELYELLCTIQKNMAHPFLTPKVLAETNLGKVMKPFRHGGYSAKSKEVARHIIRYWRKVCLEA